MRPTSTLAKKNSFYTGDKDEHDGKNDDDDLLPDMRPRARTEVSRPCRRLKRECDGSDTLKSLPGVEIESMEANVLLDDGDNMKGVFLDDENINLEQPQEEFNNIVFNIGSSLTVVDGDHNDDDNDDDDKSNYDNDDTCDEYTSSSSSFTKHSSLNSMSSVEVSTASGASHSSSNPRSIIINNTKLSHAHNIVTTNHDTQNADSGSNHGAQGESPSEVGECVNHRSCSTEEQNDAFPDDENGFSAAEISRSENSLINEAVDEAVIEVLNQLIEDVIMSLTSNNDFSDAHSNVASSTSQRSSFTASSRSSFSSFNSSGRSSGSSRDSSLMRPLDNVRSIWNHGNRRSHVPRVNNTTDVVDGGMDESRTGGAYQDYSGCGSGEHYDNRSLR